MVRRERTSSYSPILLVTLAAAYLATTSTAFSPRHPPPRQRQQSTLKLSIDSIRSRSSWRIQNHHRTDALLMTGNRDSSSTRGKKLEETTPTKAITHQSIMSTTLYWITTKFAGWFFGICLTVLATTSLPSVGWTVVVPSASILASPTTVVVQDQDRKSHLPFYKTTISPLSSPLLHETTRSPLSAPTTTTTTTLSD